MSPYLYLNIIFSSFAKISVDPQCSWSEPKTSALFEDLVISLYLAALCVEQKFQHFAVMEKFDSDKQIVKMLPNLKQSQNPETLGGPWNMHLLYVYCVIVYVQEWKCHQGRIFKIEPYLINDLTRDMKIGSGGLKL